MAQKKFTPALVDGLRTGSISDPETPGLSVEVIGSGKKVWRYKRRVAGLGDIVKMTLGGYPAYSIADARDWARPLNVQVERGENPRAKLQAAAARQVMTVDHVHTLYLESCQRSDRKKVLRPRTLDEKRRIFAADISPTIGTRVIHDITDDDLWLLVEAKAKKTPVSANRLATEMKTFFKWAASRDGKLAGVGLTVDPAVTLEGARYRQTARERFLSDDELTLLLRALAEPETLVGHYPVDREARDKADDRCRRYRRAILLMLLTGCRKDEVLSARADEYRDGIWSIPADRVKNAMTHRIPLGDWGRALIQTNEEWVIGSWKIDGPQTAGWYKVLDRLHDRMSELAGETVPRWVFHDLRRTMRSNTRSLGIDRDTAEAMINHKKTGIIAIYDRGDMLDDLRPAFAKWEAKIARLARAAGVKKALYLP